MANLQQMFRRVWLREQAILEVGSRVREELVNSRIVLRVDPWTTCKRTVVQPVRAPVGRARQDLTGVIGPIFEATFDHHVHIGLEDGVLGGRQRQADTGFLAENSGVVTSIQGPSGSEPAVFGEITSWVIAAESATDPASQFVEYMMNDGYEPWIAIAPEGKVPVRVGDSEGSTNFIDAWDKMDVGVDTKAPLSEFYSQDVLDALSTGPEELARWAIPQGQGDLLGAIQGQQPVAEAVNKVASGEDPEEAATAAAEAVRSAQGS